MPVVQLWGLPGSGRSRLVEALLDDADARAVGLPPVALADRERGVAAVCEAVSRGARWLVATAAMPDVRVLDALAAEIAPPVRLLVVTGRRLELAPLIEEVITPRELALETAEAAQLWRQAAGEEIPLDTARALTAAADGWLRPLELAAQADDFDPSLDRGLGPGRRSQGDVDALAERLARLPGVAELLEHRLLAPLAEEHRQAIVQTVGSDGAAPPGRSRELLDEVGLLVRRGDEVRLPRLLAAHIRRTAPGPTTAAMGSETPSPSPPAAGFERLGEDGATQLRLHLFGQAWAERVDGDGEPETLHWPLKRAFKALAYLASSPDYRASREDLVEALWPDAGEAEIRRNFHPTLSHLRRGIRGGRKASADDLEPLLYGDGAYRLNPQISWWIDLESFEHAWERGATLARTGRDAEAVDAWREAWRLYRGAFLEGCYDPWVSPRREAFQRRYLSVLAELGDALLRLERPREALDAYRAVLTDDPLRERVHLEVMRLYGRDGRRDLVRHQYDRLSRLLRDELGIEPLPETTDEYHRLMSDRR